jgi:tRNA(Met) C34 N-acetyltransferase TmcA
MVITNMTTLPYEMAGKGFGTQALKQLLEWAHQQGIETIQAVQVQGRSESFWTKNGFVPLKNITNDFRYVRTT